MAAPRFFVDLDFIVGQALTLPDAVAHHAVRVLRLRDGDPIVLFNGRGGEFAARLQVRGSHANAQVERFDPIERESSLHLTLVQAWVAAEKLDWIVEKATELGAARIAFVPAERCVVRLQGERRERRLAHLRQLAIAACEQCGRNRVPTIAAADTLAAALESAGAAARLILAPDAEVPLAHAVPESSAALLVGPEGGFSPHEVAAALRLGCQAVRLGARVLRTETAGLAALAALQALRGDLAR
jgi:16S rRNA (uracil1498-N3)-methyltransferase